MVFIFFVLERFQGHGFLNNFPFENTYHMLFQCPMFVSVLLLIFVFYGVEKCLLFVEILF